jgi:hypothetical protein
MAKQQEEEKKDTGLFDMTVGQGLIEVEEKSTGTPAEDDPSKKGDEPEKSKDKPKPKIEGEDFVEYTDGTFEINENKPDVEKEAKSKDNEDDPFFEKTEDKDKEKKAPSKTPSSDSSSSSPYLAFARDRANEGVFLDFTEAEWTTLVERNEGNEADALRELSRISIQERIKDGIENFKESITPEDRALYEAREKGLPLDEYGMAKRNYDRYSKIKSEDLEDDEKLQAELVAKVLELRGYEEDDIKEEIEGYKTLEVLAKKAEKARTMLPGAYKTYIDEMDKNAQEEEQARKDKIRQRVAKRKRDIENTPEIIPGIKLTKPAKQKIIESMTLPVAKDDEGNPMNAVMTTRSKNPDAFEMMMHYYHALGLFNIDDEGQMKPDFSKITKIQKTKVADEMKNVFETREKVIQGKPQIIGSQEEDDDEFARAFRAIK